MKSTQEITQEVRELGQWIPALRQQVGHVVIGQKYLVDRLLLGLLANGHILLEGVPGLAKTLTVKTMAACIQTGFQRLQFTPDLLPADLIGTLIYNPRTGEFTTKLGPLFSNLILADYDMRHLFAHGRNPAAQFLHFMRDFLRRFHTV